MRKYISMAPRWKGVLMSNNEKFNTLLNSCDHSQEIYNVLLTLVKPSLQKSDDMSEKRKIIVGNLLSIFDQTKSD